MITKPKFRKGSVVWVQGKVFAPYLDENETETGVTFLEQFDGRQHLFIPIKHIRPNVTRKQIEKWYLKHVGIGKTRDSFDSLCELLGVK